MTVIELIMHLRKSVSDKGMDIAVTDGNGNIIQLNEKNLVIGCCGQWWFLRRRRMNEELMIEALRNENLFLQEEVDRYRRQNKELMELIFKIRLK